MTNKGMRNKMKKTFACVLSAAVMMSCASVPALAADEDAVFVEEDTDDSEEVTETEVSESENEDGEEIQIEDSEDADSEESDTEEIDVQDAEEEQISDDADAATVFDDGSAEYTQNDGISKSADLEDMNSKVVTKVNNDNFSSILHSPLANTNGKYFQLTEDIVVNGWETAEYFGGVLDGNGHTITFQNGSSCFIHYLSGTLQNIGFLGAIENTASDIRETGGDACVAATCRGKILNCYLNMTYAGACTYAGGLAGIIQSGTVSNCAIRISASSKKVFPVAQDITSSGTGISVGGLKVSNCFWSMDSTDSSYGDGYNQLEQGSSISNCTSETAENMLADLNTYKGANAVIWLRGADGYPVLKSTTIPRNQYTVSFTSYDGKTKIDDVKTQGISWRIQDVPESQNVGHLEVNGFDGKVAWLLSQYDNKTHVDSTESNIWPGLYTGDLAVKGTGTATIVAWDESTLSHTTDKQDVPNENSVELARFTVEVTAGNVAKIRLLANGNPISGDKLTVSGSEWVKLTPQTQQSGSDKWETVPVSSVNFPKSTEEGTYESLVSTTSAQYRAKKPGKFSLTVAGYEKEYTVEVNSEYVPVQAISPAVSGTVKVYPEGYKGDGSQKILGTVITRDVFNGSVNVIPYNASYAYDWTMTSSDEEVVVYHEGGDGSTTGIMPKKIGEATLTVKSVDPGLSAQVTGKTTVKFVYADEVAVEEFNKVMKNLPAADWITKNDEKTLKEAEFIYNNLSDENKEKVSGADKDRLVKCREKLDGAKKDDIQKPTVKAAISLNHKTLPLTVKQSTTAVKIQKSAIKGDTIKSAKSSNKKVVSVSVKNGKLTIKGLKKGKAVITVTSLKGATAKVTVTVQKKAVTLKKLSAAVDKKWTVKKGKKVTLKVTKAPVTAAGKVKWTTSDKKVATVSSKGVVKTKKKGTAIITAKIGQKKVNFKITVK